MGNVSRLFKRVFGERGSIQRKAIFIYLFAALMPIIMISVLSSIVYYKSILNKSDELLSQYAYQHEIVVLERMDAFEKVFFELITNKELIQSAERLNTLNPEKTAKDYEDIKRMLCNTVYTYKDIRGIEFLADSGESALYTRWYSSTGETAFSNEAFKASVREKRDDLNRVEYIGTMDMNENIKKEDYVFLQAMNVRDLHTKKASGVLVMAIQSKAFLFDSPVNMQKNGGLTTAVVDENDRIIAVENEYYINKKVGDLITAVSERSSGIKEMRHDIAGTDLTLVYLYDTGLYIKEIARVLKIIFILTALITLAFFIVVLLVTRKYAISIKGIAKSIADYKGLENQGEEQLEGLHDILNEHNELYVIVKQFSNMKARITQLIETLKKRNEEVRAAAISQKNAELKALEAQINPHFLYNTLDSINWRAIEHNEVEISDMLSSLGSLLRYSISNIDMQVILDAEISWLKRYIFLQRERFNYSFDCECQITEEARSFTVYKMLLQPIVENIILHGFAEVKEGGIIEVKAFVRADGFLQISVCDNGKGISSERLQEIRADISASKALNSNSIGISNVIHRLRIYYHEGVQLLVDSKEGEGTQVTMILPKA